MSFQCKKCDKIFLRNIDMDRHISRKISCDRYLSCKRCDKKFGKLGDLKRHNARKTPCDNNINILKLRLKIEQEKTKQANARVNVTNIENQYNNFTFNINIANLTNLNPHNLTINEARDIGNIGSIPDIITALLKHQYNSEEDDLQNNKCIKCIQNKYHVKLNDTTETVKFDDIRSFLLKNIKQLIDSVIGDFYPTERRIEEVCNCLTNEIIKLYETTSKFSHNTRNNGIIKKSLHNALV